MTYKKLQNFTLEDVANLVQKVQRNPNLQLEQIIPVQQNSDALTMLCDQVDMLSKQRNEFVNNLKQQIMDLKEIVSHNRTCDFRSLQKVNEQLSKETNNNNLQQIYQHQKQSIVQQKQNELQTPNSVLQTKYQNYKQINSLMQNAAQNLERKFLIVNSERQKHKQTQIDVDKLKYGIFLLNNEQNPDQNLKQYDGFQTVPKQNTVIQTQKFDEMQKQYAESQQNEAKNNEEQSGQKSYLGDSLTLSNREKDESKKEIDEQKIVQNQQQDKQVQNECQLSKLSADQEKSYLGSAVSTSSKVKSCTRSQLENRYGKAFFEIEPKTSAQVELMNKTNTENILNTCDKQTRQFEIESIINIKLKIVKEKMEQILKIQSSFEVLIGELNKFKPIHDNELKMLKKKVNCCYIKIQLYFKFWRMIMLKQVKQQCVRRLQKWYKQQQLKQMQKAQKHLQIAYLKRKLIVLKEICK